MPLLYCADILQYKEWATMKITAVTVDVLNTCTYTGNARLQLAMQLWWSRNTRDGAAVSVA